MEKTRVIFVIVIFAFVVSFLSLSSGASVTSCTTINASGSYSLGANIASNNTCLTINASNVSLDCTYYNVTYNVNGTNSTYGIYAYNVSNISIANCNVQDVNSSGNFGYGIFFNGTINSLIVNNTVLTNGSSYSYGIYLILSSVGNVVQSNIVNVSGGSGLRNRGIVYENGSIAETSFNIVYTNGTAGLNSGISTLSGSVYPAGYNFTFNNISTYAVSGGNNHGMFLANITGANISHNTVFTNGADRNHGIALVGEVNDDNEISFNNVTTAGTIYAFGISFSWGPWMNRAHHNTINTSGSSTYSFGVDFYFNASFNNITNNTILTNVAGSSHHGVYIERDSSYNFIAYNNITTLGSGSAGVAFEPQGYNTSSNTIYKNKIVLRNNDAAGVLIWANDLIGANISSNQITLDGDSRDYGVYMQTSEGCSVFDNNITSISNNTRGFYVSGGINNTLLGNFVNLTGTNSSGYWVGVSTRASDNNTLSNLTFVRTSNIVSIESNSVALGELSSSEVSGLASPSGKTALGKYFNITNLSNGASAYLNVQYSDSELSSSGISDESTLLLYRWTGSEWSSTGFYSSAQSGVDVTTNLVYANITTFGVFGVFGSTPAAPAPTLPQEEQTVGNPPASNPPSNNGPGETVECVPNWECSDWGACSNGESTRSCSDANSCSSGSGEPETTLECAPTNKNNPEEQCIPNFQCGEWGQCQYSSSIEDIFSGTISLFGSQKRDCIDSNSCLASYVDSKDCLATQQLVSRENNASSESNLNLNESNEVSASNEQPNEPIVLEPQIVQNADGQTVVVGVNSKSGEQNVIINVKALEDKKLEVSFVQGSENDRIIRSCFDAVRNGGEEKIDCGGECRKCSIQTGFDYSADFSWFALMGFLFTEMVYFGLKSYAMFHFPHLRRFRL